MKLIRRSYKNTNMKNLKQLLTNYKCIYYGRIPNCVRHRPRHLRNFTVHITNVNAQKYCDDTAIPISNSWFLIFRECALVSCTMKILRWWGWCRTQFGALEIIPIVTSIVYDQRYDDKGSDPNLYTIKY